MPDLAGAMVAVLAELTSAGIRAASDTRDLNPPCVHLNPPEIAWRFGKGWDATWRAYIVSADTGPTESLDTIGGLLEQVQTALGGRVVSARPAELLSLDGGPPLPAYELNWSDRIR